MGENRVVEKAPQKLLTLDQPDAQTEGLFESVARQVEKKSPEQALSETADLLIEQSIDRADRHRQIAGALAGFVTFFATLSLGVEFTAAINNMPDSLNGLKPILGGALGLAEIYGVMTLPKYAYIGAQNTALAKDLEIFRSSLKKALKKKAN